VANSNDAKSEDPVATESSLVGVMAILPAWTEPFLAYLLCKELPEDKMEALHIMW
jgi:hypothetical protein